MSPALRHPARFIALTALFLFALVATRPAFASWPDDGAPAGTGSLDQRPGFFATQSVGTSVCPDADGGLICAYLSGPLPGGTIGINRLEGVNGDRSWSGATGIVVRASTAAGPPHVVTDHAGGAWVAWLDSRTGASGVYVQHYDPNGIAQMASGGLRASDGGVSSIDGAKDLDIEVTPSGKLLLAFWDGGLRVQRLTYFGTAEFGTAGTLVTSDAGAPRLDLVADGEGAVVVWHSTRSGQSGLNSVFANRVSSTGVALWGAEGSLVFSQLNGVEYATHCAWDGSSLFVSWAHGNLISRPGYSDVLAQKLNSSGTIQWGTSSTAATVLLAPADPDYLFVEYPQTQPEIVADGAGGCILSWVDFRNYGEDVGGFPRAQDIYVQRLDAAGVAQLTSNGAVLNNLPGTQADLQMAPDGAGGAVLFYMDYVDVDRNVHVHRISGSGSSVWSSFATYGDGDEQYQPVGAPDGAGGGVVAWQDDRNGGSGMDCYATHIGSNGAYFVASIELDAPNGGESFHPFDVTTVSWSSTVAGNAKLEYSIGGGAPVTIVASTPNDGSYTWTVPNVSSDLVRLRVSDAADGTPLDESDADFTICPVFASAVNISAGTSPMDVATADFDEDGIQDLAVSNFGSSSVSVFLGSGAAGVGNGLFAPPAAYAVTSPRGIEVGDFDEDGRLDLAVASANAVGVSILFGQGTGSLGDGTFASPVSYLAGTNPQGIASADFDEDGIADLAIANAGSNSVSVFLGNGSSGIGDGTFAAAVNYAAGTGALQLAVGDFNEDGVFDLAVTNNNIAANSVSILLGNGAGGVGNGTFAAAADYAAPNNPYSIATGDFDEDGITDLAVSNAGAGNRVSILRGLGAAGAGNGTFAPPATYAANATPRDLAVADFDGNGIADLLVSNGPLNEGSLLIGQGAGSDGDGTFAAPRVVSTGTNPIGLAIGDFLEDDRPDFSVANSGSASIQVLRGGCGASAPVGITLATPNGAEVWTLGTNHTINWSNGEGVVAVDIEVSHDGGVIWELIAAHQTGTSFEWTVGGPPTATALVRLHDSSIPNRRDESDATFFITPDAVGAPEASAGGASFAAGWPNPFTERVAFRLTLARPGPTRVAVRDVAGRTVRTLVDASLAAGERIVWWDGRDESGRGAPSGVYFVQASTQGFEAARRVLRMK